jgi:hypothetical protein
VFKILGSVGVSATAWFAVLVSEALARGEGERVGENLGELLGGWAKSLYVGIAAIVALVFLLNRRFADLAVFIAAAVIVGGFVLAPDEIAATVRDLWRTLTA